MDEIPIKVTCGNCGYGTDDAIQTGFAYVFLKKGTKRENIECPRCLTRSLILFKTQFDSNSLCAGEVILKFQQLYALFALMGDYDETKRKIYGAKIMEDFKTIVSSLEKEMIELTPKEP